MLAKQVIVITGERIADVGPEAQVKIPAGAQVFDLGGATVLPGLIDAHTHMFDTRGPQTNTNTERAMALAIANVQADLRAGFTSARDMSTHGNGYGDIEIRDAINAGRIDGPRYQVSTLGIVWGEKPRDPAHPDNPLASTVVRSVEDARAAVREQAAHGADWIKLFPTGAYSFQPNGKVDYVLTYPKPVLDALIGEAHRLGKKTACHVYGGEGERNAILAGCDTIEHAFDLDQEQANMMVAKGLFYDPTFAALPGAEYRRHRFEEYGRQVPHDRDLRQGRVDGCEYQGDEDHGGQRGGRRDVCARDAGAGVRGAGEARGDARGACDTERNDGERGGAGMAGPRRERGEGQVRGPGGGVGRSHSRISPNSSG